MHRRYALCRSPTASVWEIVACFSIPSPRPVVPSQRHSSPLPGWVFRPVIVGRAGDDPEGVFIREEFQKAGVDVSRFMLEPNVFSRAVLVLVDQATGERCFTSRRETNTPLAISDLDRQEIASAKVLHLDDADEPSLQAAEVGESGGGDCGAWMAPGTAKCS